MNTILHAPRITDPADPADGTELIEPGAWADAEPIDEPTALDPAYALCLAVMNQLDFGLAVVGADAEVMLMNRAAERACAAGTFVALEHGRLRPRSSYPLLAAVEKALAGLRHMVPMVVDGEALPLMVVPLVAEGARGGPLALVVFGRQRLADPIVTEMYARSRRLTGAEAAILRELGDGCSPKQCSARAGVRMSTVRTHLSSAREKLGVDSIDALLHMVGRLPPTAPTLYGRA